MNAELRCFCSAHLPITNKKINPTARIIILEERKMMKTEKYTINKNAAFFLSPERIAGISFSSIMIELARNNERYVGCRFIPADKLT